MSYSLYIQNNISSELIQTLENLISENPYIYFRGVHSLEQAQTTASFRSVEGTRKYDRSENNIVNDLLEEGFSLDYFSDTYDVIEHEDGIEMIAKGVNATKSINLLFADTSRINGNFTHIVAFEGRELGENMCKDGVIVEIDTDEEMYIFEVK